MVELTGITFALSGSRCNRNIVPVVADQRLQAFLPRVSRSRVAQVREEAGDFRRIRLTCGTNVDAVTAPR